MTQWSTASTVATSVAAVIATVGACFIAAALMPGRVNIPPAAASACAPFGGVANVQPCAVRCTCNDGAVVDTDNSCDIACRGLWPHGGVRSARDVPSFTRCGDGSRFELACADVEALP